MWFVFQDTLRVVTVVPASVLHGSAADRGPENSVGAQRECPPRVGGRGDLYRPPGWMTGWLRASQLRPGRGHRLLSTDPGASEKPWILNDRARNHLSFHVTPHSQTDISHISTPVSPRYPQRNHRQGKPFTGEAIQRNPVGQADWVKLEM
ncbi:unnamed protein product [Boreogadus saida]